MKVSSDLLDALQMTRVRDAGEYEAMSTRRTSASGYGSIHYRLREPRRVQELPGEALSTYGNAVVGGLQLSYIADRLGTEVTFPEAHPHSLCIMTVLEGAVHYRPFGSEAASTAGSGGLQLFQALPGAQALTTDGSERLNLWVNAQTLNSRLEAMLEQKLAAPLAFAPAQDWPQGVAGSLKRLVWYVATELADPYSFFAGGVGVAGFEELVMRTLLEGVTHNYVERLAGPPRAAPPHTVQRATAFMRENVWQPVTVEDIARAAGCSARALAAAFRSHRERTVTSVLRDLRLDAAREAFATGNPALKVGDVAARLGFSNPGRFARLYRERFGEMPLQTRSSHFLVRPARSSARKTLREHGSR